MLQILQRSSLCGVQDDTVDMYLVWSHRKLAALITLIPVEYSDRLPSASRSGYLFDTRDASDLVVDIGISSERHRKSTTRNVELVWCGLEHKHRSVLDE